MVMLPTFLAGTNWVMHSAGWLEGGLVSSYEKFIIDIEILRMLQVEFTPIEFDDAALAFDAHQEVGHGGHFLGCQHTMERFRTPHEQLGRSIDSLGACGRRGRRAHGVGHQSHVMSVG